MKTLLIYFALFISLPCMAQEQSLNPDSSKLDSILEHVDMTKLTTGILYDRAVHYAGLTTFNTTGNISDQSHFEQALYELYRASKTSKFMTHRKLREVAASKSDRNTVPVGIINTSFQSLNYDPKNPKESGLLLQNGKMQSIEGKASFKENQALVIAPLEEYARGSKVTYQFLENYIFEEGKRKLTKLVVDFGMGSTHTVMGQGKLLVQKLAIDYEETGYKTLTFLVTFSDGTRLKTQGRIHVKLPTESLNQRSGFIKSESVQSTFEFKGYAESAPIKGKVDYRIYYRTGATSKKLQKPILVLDGFDPGDKRKFEDADSDRPDDEHVSIAEFMSYEKNGRQEDLILELRALGYDVVLINHPSYTRNGKEIDGGADYIERNGFNLVSLIQEFNKELKTNGSKEKLVIVGPSMGGQISRYALAYMEDRNLDHNTRLWVSIDSPHLGANIPMGLQSFVNFAAPDQAGAKDFVEDQLGSAAAKQQL